MHLQFRYGSQSCESVTVNPTDGIPAEVSAMVQQTYIKSLKNIYRYTKFQQMKLCKSIALNSGGLKYLSTSYLSVPRATLA